MADMLNVTAPATTLAWVPSPSPVRAARPASAPAWAWPSARWSRPASRSRSAWAWRSPSPSASLGLHLRLWRRGRLRLGLGASRSRPAAPRTEPGPASLRTVELPPTAGADRSVGCGAPLTWVELNTTTADRIIPITSGRSRIQLRRLTSHPFRQAPPRRLDERRRSIRRRRIALENVGQRIDCRRSNWVPAQRRSSASAASGDRAARYGRAVVIAWKASATSRMREASGISSPRSPCGYPLPSMCS